MNAFDKVREAVKSVRAITSFEPEIALVLGSGLGSFADEIEVETVIPSDKIAFYPGSTVSGHKGNLVFGRVEGKKVVIQQGRAHYYEGYAPDEVVLPVRLMGALGAKKVILTNAAGGVNPAFHGGDFMLITGQISQFVPSPLRGENDESFGARFPDMSEIYSRRLLEKAEAAAKRIGVKTQKGVYLQASGPNYESPEEIRAFSVLGADAVGMSTAVEAIAAKHMGKEILGVSLISNMAAGIQKTPLSHEEVKAAADKASRDFVRLVREIVKDI